MRSSDRTDGRPVPGKETCPVCRGPNVKTIVYGLPGPEALEAEQRGQVVLAGCVLPGFLYDRLCGRCGHKWVARGDSQRSS